MEMRPEPNAAIIGGGIQAKIQKWPDGFALVRVNVRIFKVNIVIDSDEQGHPKSRGPVKVRSEVGAKMGAQIAP